MKHWLKKISISNFRNISFALLPEKYFQYDFEDSDLVVLGGKNGYGKTTLFSAIEMLITGEIKHMEKGRDILNRGQVSRSVFANDVTKDISIVGEFANESKVIKIERKISNISGHTESQLFDKTNIPETEISEQSFFDMLKINKNIFHTACYISQSESLSFMTQKYKDRKESIAHIVNISEYLDVESKIKQYRALYNRKSGDMIQEKRESNKLLITKADKIKESLRALAQSIQKQPAYENLFNQNYCFDVENIDITKYSYSDVIMEPKAILDYISNINDYDKYLYNLIVEKEIKRPKNEYRAVFFRNIIAELKGKEEFIQDIKVIKTITADQLLDDYKNFSTLLKTHKVFEEEIHLQYEKLLQDEKDILSRTKGISQNLNNIIVERSKLVELYKKGLEQGTIQENLCVFCGSSADNILDSIEKTTQFLKKDIDDSSKQLLEIKDAKTHFVKEQLYPEKNIFDSANKILLALHNYLEASFLLDIDEIQKNMGLIDFDAFIYKLETAELNEINQSFESEYDMHIGMLRKKKHALTQDISEKAEEYKRVKQTYYSELKVHASEQLEMKISYISVVFNDALRHELTSLEKTISLNNEKCDKFEVEVRKESETIDYIYKVVFDALKLYQEEIAVEIKIPLFIYSGKIIQNYHFGLGISIIVETNQLVFTINNYFSDLVSREDKKLDVYNILSLGQLNALMMAILLAINSTYGSHTGFDCILIDDPLQSIDDINSVAFADLLSQQFSNGKIIISTHEIEKARLLTYKYMQSGLSVKNIDVMQKYLSD